MTHAVDVIKQGGARPPEAFDHDKLHASIQSACLSVRSHEGHAELTATAVCQAVLDWLENKFEVTSEDIRRVASAHLEIFHPEAAYFYKHQNLVI